mgnify:CR=1 FL=1
MKLSEGIEWSIHLCTLLAALPSGKALTGAKLAEFFDLPKPYLAKHLQSLSAANLLSVKKGPGGGYSLARSAEQITMFDVLRALGEAGPSFSCTEIRRRGPSGVGPEAYSKPCGIARVMRRADQTWAEELKSVSIADLNKEAAAEVHPDQTHKALKWLGETFNQ